MRTPIGILGNLFVTDGLNARVRGVDAASGIISTFAGNGMHGSGGDGRPATQASLRRPARIAIDTVEASWALQQIVV